MTKTELEALAYALEEKIISEWYTRTVRIYPDLLAAITTAFNLGRAQAPLTEPQRAAWERNRRRGGKPGRKDKHQPRHRRTKAEMEAARQETQEQ